MEFQFYSPGKILFGPGTLVQLPQEVGGWGEKPLILTGTTGAYAEPVKALFPKAPFWSVPGEVTLAMVVDGVAAVQQHGCDYLIAVGGGSVIDAAKAVAAMATNPGELLEYLEIIGQGKPLTHAPLPVAAVPTTAGTGSEATMNAVIHSPEHGRKVSLRHPSLLPRLALVDPELALSLPPEVTASTGMDALTQLIEPFLSPKATPMTDALCREMLPRMLSALWAAVRQPDNLAARTELALGALSSGLVLANAGLGAVHGLAGPLGGAFGVPHGVLCARLLAPVLEVNLQVLEAQAEFDERQERFDELGYLLTGLPEAGARDALANIEQLTEGLPLPSLQSYDIDLSRLPELCQMAQSSSSMRGNPVSLTAEQLLQALERAMEA